MKLLKIIQKKKGSSVPLMSRYLDCTSPEKGVVRSTILLMPTSLLCGLKRLMKIQGEV